MEGIDGLLPILQKSPDAATIILLVFVLKKQFDLDRAMRSFGERLSKLEGFINAIRQD